MLDLTKLTIFFGRTKPIGIINPTYLGGFQTLKIHCRVVAVDRFFVVGLINFCVGLDQIDDIFWTHQTYYWDN